jgi:hypothetical protein
MLAGRRRAREVITVHDDVDAATGLERRPHRTVKERCCNARCTAGAAEAAAPEEVVASRFIVRQILDRIEGHIEEAVAQRLRGEALAIFKRLLASRLRRALWGAAEGAVAGGTTSAGVDLAAQEAQVRIFNTRDDVDLGEAAHAAEGGALFGAAGGTASGAIRRSERKAVTGYLQGTLRSTLRGPVHIPADAIPHGNHDRMLPYILFPNGCGSSGGTRESARAS